MAVITNWKVERRNYKKQTFENNYLEVRERAKIFVWYDPDRTQNRLPFLTPDVYNYLESDGKNEMINYEKYDITETEPSACTMKFTTDQHFDPTKGQWRVLLLHPNHRAFYGFILDDDYDESTKLYSYQCQDGSRAYQSKTQFASSHALQKYGMIKTLLAGGLDKNGKGYFEDKYSLAGLRRLEDYKQPTIGSIKECNPLSASVPSYLTYDSFIDQIRGLCLSDGANIKVYFDKYGICQVKPIESKEVQQTATDNGFLYFSLKDMSSNTYSMDKTNVITNIRVKRDKTNASSGYRSETLFDVPVTFYFGNSDSYLDAIDTTGLPTVQSQSTEDNNNANTNANVATGTTKDIITVNHMPSCGCHGKVAYKRYTKSYKNYCPNCKRTGTLTDNPKKVYEGEITCGNRRNIKGCDSDFCGYCGTDKNGTCRSRLTPATATATTNTGGVNADGSTQQTAQTTQVDYNSQEYQDREKQQAVDKMQESFVGMFDYKMKIPLNNPLFKRLGTDVMIFAELPKGWTLENIEKWDNLFFGESSYWTNYQISRYFIRNLKITGDANGTWADITISPFRMSHSSYTSWLRKAEQAYASATAANNNATGTGTGTGTSAGLGQPKLGADCTATNSMRAMSGGGYGNSGHGRNFDGAAQKGYAVQGANYYNWARQYKDIKSLCRAMAKRFSYSRYWNNRTCPQRVHNNGGTISCNCYDACRYVKVCCDSCGFPCVIITGSIWEGGHGWNAVKYNGTWYTFDLCYTSKGTSTNGTNSFRAVW